MHSTLTGAIALFGILTAWVGLSVFSVVSWTNLRLGIELHHPDLARRLDLPPISEPRRMRFGGRWLFVRYVLTGRYREEGDPALTRLGDRAWLSFAVTFLIWLSAFVYLFGFAAHR